MQLRIIPDDFEQRAVDEIDRRLANLAATHNVTIPWAIESGSRAWGFPSPDSDYDARFIYVRSIDQYLSPWQPRDVIEMPIEDDMDVNGWDLGKAIKLLLKGDAVVTEWLQSPIIYCGDSTFRDAMLALAEQCADRQNAIRHYYHLGTQQWQWILAKGDEAPAKKLFYAARPALCLRWLRVHGDRKVPPMRFQTLLHEAETPLAILHNFDVLVAAKAQTRELGYAKVSDAVREFIDGEFQCTEAALNQTIGQQSPENLAMARTLFFETVNRFSGMANAMATDLTKI